MAIKWKKKEEDSINEHFPYGLRSATSTNLQVPRPKSEYFKRTFLYSGTNLCNSLPFNIKSLNSEICFKTKVKYYLLRFKLRMPNFQDLLCVNICIWVNIRIWQNFFFLSKWIKFIIPYNNFVNIPTIIFKSDNVCSSLL